MVGTVCDDVLDVALSVYLIDDVDAATRRQSTLDLVPLGDEKNGYKRAVIKDISNHKVILVSL